MLCTIPVFKGKINSAFLLGHFAFPLCSRTSINLRYQLNLNCVDIAEYLHISHEASRARLSRAKQHYAHLLAKERLM